VSLVINRSPAAKSIPHGTQERVRQAARELNYRPNFMARSLRAQRSFTIGVVVAGDQRWIRGAWSCPGLKTTFWRRVFLFCCQPQAPCRFDRGVSAIAAAAGGRGPDRGGHRLSEGVQIPVVAISGHRELEGVTNIALDHPCAAKLALEHLVNLGHRKIAFIKGQEFSSDTEVRWQSVQGAAKNLALEINERLVVQLEGESPSPILGYQVTSKLLATGEPFTALFAFNDISRDRGHTRSARGGPQSAGRCFRGRLRRYSERGVPESGADDRAPAFAPNGNPRCGNGLEPHQCAGEVFDLSQKHTRGAGIDCPRDNGAPSPLKRELIVLQVLAYCIPGKLDRNRRVRSAFSAVLGRSRISSVFRLRPWKFLRLRRRQICSAPHTESLYWLPASPDALIVRRSRAGVHNSERMRKPCEVSPIAGNVEL